MTTVVRWHGCSFQIYSDDHGIPHCHVIGHGSRIKISLIDFKILGTTGFSERDAKRLIEVVKRYHAELLAKWEEYHGETEKD